MAYKIIVLPDAEKQLAKLEIFVARRIVKKLIWISVQDNPLRFAVPLHHSSIGDIRFRIGDYRATALVDEKKNIIKISAIGHRKEIYR